MGKEVIGHTLYELANGTYTTLMHCAENKDQHSDFIFFSGYTLPQFWKPGDHFGCYFASDTILIKKDSLLLKYWYQRNEIYDKDDNMDKMSFSLTLK